MRQIQIRICFLFLLLLFVFVSPALSETFTFDTSNQGWQQVGLYDGGGLMQVPGFFDSNPAPWSDLFGSGAILIGSGGFTMPDSPTNNLYLHWDLNSPHLGNDSQWQGITSFQYDVTGQYMASFQPVYVQAVLLVQKPDGTITYFTDGIFNEIPMESAGQWSTYTVDVESLSMPANTIILNVNLRFFFRSGSGHDGYLRVDNVIPSGGSDSSVGGESESDKFTFDYSNQEWRHAGLYDAGGLNPVLDFFHEGPAGYWSDVPGSGVIRFFTLEFLMPDSPTNDQYLHWDLISPDLNTVNQWQGITSFQYDVTGEGMSSNKSVSVQAVLRVKKPDGSISYFTDGQFNEIPLASAAQWNTFFVDVEGLGMPAGTIVLNVNLRFFFEAGMAYDGYISVDNVTPTSGGDGTEDDDPVVLEPPTDPIVDDDPELGLIPPLDILNNTCENAQMVELYDCADASTCKSAHIEANIDTENDVDWYAVDLPFFFPGGDVDIKLSSTQEGIFVDHYWECSMEASEWDSSTYYREGTLMWPPSANIEWWVFEGYTSGAGTLYLKVRGESTNVTGEYDLTITFTSDVFILPLPLPDLEIIPLPIPDLEILPLPEDDELIPLPLPLPIPDLEIIPLPEPDVILPLPLPDLEIIPLPIPDLEIIPLPEPDVILPLPEDDELIPLPLPLPVPDLEIIPLPDPVVILPLPIPDLEIILFP